MLYQDTLTGMLHEVPDSQVRLGIGGGSIQRGGTPDALRRTGKPTGLGVSQEVGQKGGSLCHVHAWTVRADNKRCASCCC